MHRQLVVLDVIETVDFSDLNKLDHATHFHDAGDLVLTKNHVICKNAFFNCLSFVSLSQNSRFRKTNFSNAQLNFKAVRGISSQTATSQKNSQKQTALFLFGLLELLVFFRGFLLDLLYVNAVVAWKQTPLNAGIELLLQISQTTHTKLAKLWLDRVAWNFYTTDWKQLNGRCHLSGDHSAIQDERQ